MPRGRRGAPTARRPPGAAASTAAITRVAGREPVDAVADGLDDAGGVHPRDPRRVETAAAPFSRSPMSVGFTAAARTAMRTSPGPGGADVAIDDLEDLGTAGGGDGDGAHRRRTLVVVLARSPGRPRADAPGNGVLIG